MQLRSVPDIVDVEIVRGPRAPEGAPPDLVVEIPHGATRTDDFTRIERQLTSPLPAGLVDFFHVNTDAGAPELAHAIANELAELEPARTTAILRCRIPRTFIDCNRRIDASPEDFKAGKVTPGLMPWIVTDEDRSLLRGLYERYTAAVREALAALPAAGALLLLHTYAPRSVDVAVDADIVTSLRRAYEPEVVETWPLRPEFDVIGKSADGVSFAPHSVVEALRGNLGPYVVGDSATYPLHPSTLAYDHVMARPGRALCLEVRRDLLAAPFDPFVQMTIGDQKVARLARPIANALRRWWTA